MIRSIGCIGLVACALTTACAGTAEGVEGDDARMAQGPTPASTAIAFGGGSSNASQTAMPATGAAGTALPATPAASPLAPAAPTMGVGGVTDECGLHTKFAGDEYCIKPPPPDKGFQLHNGPSNYENPEPKFVLEPGQEVTEPYSGMSSNEQDIYYFYKQQRMRPGSHHLLVSKTSGGNPELIVSAQNPLSDTPAGGKIAPEDEDVGISLPARSPLFGSIHFINTTDKPILKEFWVNFWYKDANQVKERAVPIFTGAPINVPPGAHVLISSDCPIMGSGRLLRLFGHKHANNVRWSTYRVRGSQRDLLFEDYDHWEDPLILEYSSITHNPTPDRATKSPGGMSGIVEMNQGDTLRFECEVINKTDKTFTGQNEAVDDEMCIQNGTIVGAQIMRGTCRTATTPVE